jgi:hypothetical protein
VAERIVGAVLRTLLGLALIAAGVVIEVTQYRPGLMTSVQIGDALVGPFLQCIGGTMVFWPVVQWFERWAHELRRPDGPLPPDQDASRPPRRPPTA